VRSFREKANDPLPCGRCELRRARFSLTRFATPIAGKMNCSEIQAAPFESIAAREKKTERSIRMTPSLAFLSPALVKAAIEGWLSRGFGVKRLKDRPMAWSDQWSALGLIGNGPSSQHDCLHEGRSMTLPPRPVERGWRLLLAVS
jgi:hypothetical protein